MILSLFRWPYSLATKEKKRNLEVYLFPKSVMGTIVVCPPPPRYKGKGRENGNTRGWCGIEENKRDGEGAIASTLAFFHPT